MLRKLLNELLGCSFMKMNFHEWSDWEIMQEWDFRSVLEKILEEPEEGVTELIEEALEDIDASEIVQKRTCLSCQKIEIQRISLGDCVHVWGKWKVYDQPMVRHGEHGYDYVDRRQKRICTKCGLVEDINMNLG